MRARPRACGWSPFLIAVGPSLLKSHVLLVSHVLVSVMAVDTPTASPLDHPHRDSVRGKVRRLSRQCKTGNGPKGSRRYVWGCTSHLEPNYMTAVPEGGDRLPARSGVLGDKARRSTDERHRPDIGPVAILGTLRAQLPERDPRPIRGPVDETARGVAQ